MMVCTALCMVVSMIVPFVNAQTSVSLLDTAMMVQEGQQFAIRVKRTGDFASTFYVIVAVSSPLDTDLDFIGSSHVGSFNPSGSDTISVVFTVNNDTIPEVEETFTLQLSVVNPGVTVAEPSKAAITIAANDDAYGAFSFLDVSPVMVTEDISDKSEVYLGVSRSRGTHGQIIVSYSIDGTDIDAQAGQDIIPRSGTVLFNDGEIKKYIKLEVMPDNFPEKEETFLVSFTGASQNARVSTTPQTVIIMANDAPVRFKQSEIRVEEGEDIIIQVYRGIDSDGSNVGSFGAIASVDYTILSDTAVAGKDFSGRNGQVVFEVGEVEGTITISILDDTDPEVEESFNITLETPVGDVVLMSPTRIKVIINANDEHNGVLSFFSPDSLTPALVRVNEDGFPSNAVYYVIRTAGTFGTVTVRWEAYRNDTETGDVKGDITPSDGVLVFTEGVIQQVINISVIQDTIAEPTERFVLHLITGSVSGGASVEGITYGILVIEDSDNYYGTVEFGQDLDQRIIITTSPRHLQLMLTRVGLNQGNLIINFTVTYTGVPDSGMAVLEKTDYTIEFAVGQSNRIVQVPLLASAFLQVGGAFVARLLGIELQSVPSLGAYNSPVFGSRTELNIPVTLNEANGEIGFHSTTTAIINEPDSTPYQVLLQLTREGTSGQAVISWVLTGSASVTASDTGPTSGTIVMERGKSDVTLIILIMPDDEPELEEVVMVNLTHVTPTDTQRLKDTASYVEIKILENDNPGGTFQFAASMQSSYLVQELMLGSNKEGSAAIDVIVERTGGDLVTQFVQYTVQSNGIDNGADEFFGAHNVLRFDPGVRFRNSTLLAKMDNIPEILESFVLQLQPYGNVSASIGAKSKILVNISANDDPFGVIQFPNNSSTYVIGESKVSSVQAISIPVERVRGTFGTVVVMWKIDPQTNNDLMPLTGSVTFGDGQNQGFIRVESVPDELPEPSEQFLIKLVSVTGGSRIANHDTVVVTVMENDKPVYIAAIMLGFESILYLSAILAPIIHYRPKRSDVDFEPLVYAGEPSVLTIRIRRDGDGSDVASMKYRTVDGSATVANGDYQSIPPTNLVFGIGEIEKVVSIEILQDTLPENNETFYVQFYDIQGDLVFTASPNATIVILANDNAYGVFQLNPPYEKTSEEGSQVAYEIGRLEGRFGVVDVNWEIYDHITNQLLPDGGDFITANGTVRFLENELAKMIFITIRMDGEPEQDKQFRVALQSAIVVEGRTDEVLARISDTNNEALLTVKANDDPYGKFAFQLSSKNVTIAEDFYTGQEDQAKAVLTIERRQGLFRDIMISWEIFSDQLADTFPKVYDLILLSTRRNEVTFAPSKRRSGTGTDVVYLTGAVNNYLSVPTLQQPTAAEISAGFAISVWLQPFSSINSYILAKTTTDGNRFFYALRVVTSQGGTIFRFGFSITGKTTNQEVSVTSPKSIQDGAWHHLVMSIDSGTILFYLDATPLDPQSVEDGQTIIDGLGFLLIGAKAPGSDHFIGYLQDVRLYTAKLEMSHILELYNSPAAADLTPVSGYMTYRQGESSKGITIHTVQDTIDEQNEIYKVKLLGASNGASLSVTDSMARITILKSDNANGQFGFNQSCIPAVAAYENATILCSVDRSKGSEGTVNVTWSVFQLLQGGNQVEAVSDFVASTGVLTFYQGEKSKVFYLEVRDDTLPEAQETFHIKLVSVTSGDGISGTTNTSGASINPLAAFSNFVIEENDYTYGLFQFSTESTPPTPQDGVIPPGTSQPTVTVSEESGSVSLMVVRAQGAMGVVSVEWRATDGTAVNNRDYSAGVGRLTFQNGQLYDFININILDNSLPEDQKHFNVDLLNPTGGAAVGVASSITVIIDHSDGAFGVFEFGPSSLNVETDEIGDSGYSTVILQILRKQGSLGESTVTWQILGQPDNDVVETTGNVTFNHGVTLAMFEVKIRGDTVPELDELYQIQLTAVNRGSLAAAPELITSKLIIKANDNPYGLFVIASDQRPVIVSEALKNISITIERQLGQFGAVDVGYRTLTPLESPPFISGSVKRASDKDFRSALGSVSFAADQSMASFSVLIMDDEEPESDESVFVELTSVSIATPAQTNPVPNSPMLGIASERYGQIIIDHNDNAHGVLEITPLSVYTEESNPNPDINVTRMGGTFGEVSVKFRVVNGTALEHLDFEMLSDTVVLLDGERSKALPIIIKEDRLPEIRETFYVEILDQITGDAVLGNRSYSVINILPSDDPNGAFNFAVTEITVEEPENGSPFEVNVTVVRVGGSMGVVSVDWQARYQDLPPNADMVPTAGSIHFVSNEWSRNIRVSILPDDIPEGPESIEFTIVNVNNDGRIGDKNSLLLTISANDNPHGSVQFATGNYSLEERDTSSVQYIKLARIGGTFGLLRVYYTTEQIDVVEEAILEGKSLQTYFDPPQDGGRATPGSTIDLAGESDPLMVCLSSCLRVDACLAFEVRVDGNQSTCVWYITRADQPLVAKTGVKYYNKNQVKMQELLMMRATPGQDFGVVTNGYVLINDEVNEGAIPLTILADNFPELGEKFRVKLTQVEVISAGGSSKYPPTLGSQDKATVQIMKNDNAYGIFTVFSDSPAGSDGGHYLPVEEKPQYAVDLIVERQGGNVGDVTVDWFINMTATNAQYGVDYRADGATLQFAAGQTRRLITLTVLEDAAPELNETLTVQLRNPQGGADVSPDARVRVIIMENDYVAGVLGFDTTSILAKEGDSISINVTRSVSSHGVVHVDWHIQGKDGLDPAKGFNVYQGSFTFQQNEVSKTINLDVMVDQKPETNEEYQIFLTNVRTEGVGATGAAKIDAQFNEAAITIQGSNDPHGVIQFASTSLNVRVQEADNIMSLQIDRKFGAIGMVRVSYEITEGSVNPTNEELVAATVNEDFVPIKGYLDIANGASDASIKIQIKDDDIPEVDEVFIVSLTGVTLVDTDNSAIPPKLAGLGTVAQVIIDANDGTKGVIKFANDSVHVKVDEITKNISLNVFRDKGTFGDVSVFYYAQSIMEGTTQGTDYRIIPQELFFAKGESNKMIILEILDDDIPEPDETFEVILSNPTNGLQMGNESRATVTIMGNDGSSGIVSFDTDASMMIEEAGTDNSSNSVARLKVVRGPGVYGVVNVPFEIIPEFPGNTNDLSPVKGYATFQDKQSAVYIELMALDDSEPEQAERFTVRLKETDNGAVLGRYLQRMVIINPNDSPNGLIQLYIRGTRNSSISMDENIGIIYIDVERTQGTDGTAMVDVTTRPDTAVVVSDLHSVTLAPYQTIPTTQVQSWYSYTMNGTEYLLMLTNFRVGELTTMIGSNGSAEPVNVDRLFQTTLFKWRGQLIPVQTLETDAATAATTFTISGLHYMVVANQGNIRRHQTNSRIYKVNDNGSLFVLQDLVTKGAKDVKFFSYSNQHYLVFANSIDNNGLTVVDVDVFKWEQNTKMFTASPWQSLSNLGAHAVEVFEVEGVMYMAVANYYDSERKTYIVDSIVYKFGTDGMFAEHQRMRTEGAVDVAYLAVRSLHLLVFGSNRGDAISSPQTSTVYRWDSTAQRFFRDADLQTYRVESLTMFLGADDMGYLLVANGIGNSEMFYWDIQDQQFVSMWTGPPALSFHPWIIPQTAGALTLMLVADIDPQASATLYQFIKVKDSDYAPRTITMTFEPGHRMLQTSVVILQDNEPEDTETFFVSLTNPSGGADIGPQNTLTINILSNDNAHGIIEIDMDSLEVRVQELDGRDNTIQINVRRNHGYFGRVVIKWVASGDQNGLSDITPLQGQLEYTHGQSIAQISLTILNDNLAELPEVTYIRLTEVVESGTSLPGRGATIGDNNVATIIVLANDSPYGVVLWEQGVVSVSEPNSTDVTVVAYIIRQQGMMGMLRVSYQTTANTGVVVEKRAVSGDDFVAKQSVAILQENATRVPIEIVIKQDDLPEGDEFFLVNITGVTLAGPAPPPGAEPSVQVPGNLLSVTIKENDNARGIVQFNVTTNIEGRIDTYEEFGKNTSVRLKVSRTVGALGPITITWQGDPREANILDFSPSSGTLRLEDGQMDGYITIYILDDTISEEMETFDVKLISKTGGSEFGPNRSVRVAILKNDSPNGLFRFVTSEVTVKESRSVDDPEGEVTLQIERVQGSDGVVNVQWRLSAEAVNDFDDPQSGTIQFAQGKTTMSVVLRTKMDTVLEGEERFRISLVTADNNADISHSQGDATVIISPDPGASGTISILPEFRKVYIGEPGESSPSYNGQVQIVVTRGQGIFGAIAVTWSVTPREMSTFLQSEGTVQFSDLQQKATITLQAQDDTRAELRQVYTLQINSATGGAVISNTPGEFSADIIFVASDYPHGLFEFTLPETILVEEDAMTFSVMVVRRSGLDSQVMVSYTTTPGTAQNILDFFPAAGALEFQHGEDTKLISIRVQQDDVPEGPEMFYVNLTSTRLRNPSSNNYTKIGDLQLDMAPAIGSVNVKTIVINKNDNAEGTIQFDSSAKDMSIVEEIGLAKIPLVRLGGNYGKQTVLFSTQNTTALEGIDYSVPRHEVVMEQGQTRATINITVHDDSEMEHAEHFNIILNSIVGGALLGDAVTATITILKSDYPNGNFGFSGQLAVTMPNPDRQINLNLTIHRTGGLTGQQTVFWRILGPNNPGNVLVETNDISHNENGPETTQGSLIWADAEGGEKAFQLRVKPYTSWEIQKIFVIEINKVQGFPMTVGDGEVGPSTGKVVLTIEKFGDPNGIIQFEGVAKSEQIVDEPEGTGLLDLRFPVSRLGDTGTVGSIQVFWDITGPLDDTADFQPRNGSIVIEDGQRDSAISIQVLPDDIPELTERYKLSLKSVEGGAEIANSNNVSFFNIRFNDNPHGLFGVAQSDQTVVVNPADLSRLVRLNFTRYAGTFGNVILTFQIKYDLLQTGILLSQSGGTVSFDEGQSQVVTDIPLTGDGFLEMDSSFTVTLTEVRLSGSAVTDPPAIKSGEREAKVIVPAAAANSEVGFSVTLAAVDEVTTTTTLTLVRRGTYGTLEIVWKAGFVPGNLPNNFVEGTVNPEEGSVTIAHGVSSKNFTVQLTAKPSQAELFSLHLPQAPITTISGGAKLAPNSRQVQIEPNGIIRFASNSTNPSISEMEGKIYLMVERLYGSEGKLEVVYRSEEVTADKGVDFITMETNAVMLEPGQTSGLIEIRVLQDNIPEEEETLFINLTRVEKYPTEITPRISPRLSSLYTDSIVHIEESNDPYGVLCMEPSDISVEEEYRQVNISIVRTGGLFGTVSVVVRTVGGGEMWTSMIVPSPGDTNDTIRQVLGNRQSYNVARGGEDYDVLDTKVTLQQGQQTAYVLVTVLADNAAEPDETVIVYLTQPTAGARIAEGAPDGGKKGYCVITLLQNDLSNGVIGFAESSKVIRVSEDSGNVVNLRLARTNAFYGEVEVTWTTKLALNSTEAEDTVLASQLMRTAGTTICPARQASCHFNITVRNDNIPEEAHQFIVKLVSVRRDAQLDSGSLVATVNVDSSDYVRGLLQFTENSRLVTVADTRRTVQLKVERKMGQGYRVQVGYETMQMTSQVTEHGVTINPAQEQEDYSSKVGMLVFEENRQDIETIEINLTPAILSDNPLPKQLYVTLKNPSNGASIHTDLTYSRAAVRIVEEKNLPIWIAIGEREKGPHLNDSEILRTLSHLDTIAKVDMDLTEVTLVENILSDFIDEGLRRQLPTDIINQIMNVMCNMLNPSKNDATRRRSSMATLMEKLAYTTLTGKPCPSPDPPELTSLQCVYMKMSAGRWPLEKIQNFQYQAQRLDTFTVPNKVENPPIPADNDCLDFHMMEYSSEQWFMKGDDPELLSSKIIGFGMKDKQSGYSDSPATFRIHTPDRRIATRRAQCVYYDMTTADWVNPQGTTCTVTNNLELATDDYVDCSCNHLTHYAVKATPLDAGLVGYSVWFFVVSFFVMVAMALTILVHHICANLHAMFSANLLVHMCFACFATQLCYVVAAYVSPTEILVYNIGDDNYRCIVMGLFLHYFFLSQFTWIMAQAINFWKILVLNDEHTDRKYVLFFLIGWGLPVVILAIFYVVTFNLYKYVYDMPVDFIYGDVNNNGEMCFITNPYAGLGGVILPVLLMLLVVGVVFVKAFQVTPQWQAYDDIYRGRYNINEIRTLLSFWAVITLTWLWGGLHMAYGQLWMLVMFCIFNLLQGLLALVLYTILRNPCIQQCFGPQKQLYSISADANAGAMSGGDDIRHHMASVEIGSLKGSRASLLNESWERDSIPSKSTMKVKRQLASSGNIYVTPPVLVQSTDGDTTDKDFDDLLYALKTDGSYTASDVNSLDSDKISEISSKVDKYEMRRISIADTHL
ncbi:adhesion G-protein coupled receptor V1-like isoform X2 [Argopecten irradians]|uniref:adhesion G-protein coupled receptor V1-like isoform X2 n=1 Tax=Argopecten irradians TaxID=31199 RepID=UPI00371D89F8